LSTGPAEPSIIPSEDFLLEEYKSLRSELVERARWVRTLETLGTGAIATIWAWLVSTKASFGVVWFAPAIIPVIGVARSVRVHYETKRLAEYLLRIERLLLDKALYDAGAGWERYRQGETGSYRFIPLYWTLMFTLTLAAPFVLTAGR